MKTLLITCCLWAFFVTTASSQSVGEFSPSTAKFGLKKLKKAPKKVYISTFNINFEVYKESVDFKAGGRSFGGTRRSDATARAAIGLSGIESQQVQKVTNQLYQEYLAKLKAAGLEVISPDEAAQTEFYSKWQRANGPSVSESGIPGVITVVPEGYSYLYKKESKDGKKKKGFMGGNFVAPTLSKQLDGAIIAEVDLYVMFTEDKEDLFKGAAAKVKILTNMRLVGDYAVVAEKKKGIRLKGAQTVDKITSKVSFAQGKQGLGSVVSYNGGVKKPLEVEGVIKKEKVVAYQKQGSSTPTSFSTYSFMDLADRFSKTTAWITVDGGRYASGLYNACKAAIDTHTDAFLQNVK